MRVATAVLIASIALVVAPTAMGAGAANVTFAGGEAAATTSAGAAVPYLGLAEARREANQQFTRTSFDDWNVGACFRIRRNVVQCRFWAALGTTEGTGNLRVRETWAYYNTHVLNYRLL